MSTTRRIWHLHSTGSKHPWNNTSVALSHAAKAKLKALAKQEGVSMWRALERLVFHPSAGDIIGRRKEGSDLT